MLSARLPSMTMLVFGNGPVNLWCWLLYGFGGTAVMVLIMVGPRRQWIPDVTYGLIRFQFNVMMLLSAFSFFTLGTGCSHGMTRGNFAYAIVGFPGQTMLMGFFYALVSLVAYRWRFGEWPRFSLLSKVSVLASCILVLCTMATILLVLLPIELFPQLPDLSLRDLIPDLTSLSALTNVGLTAFLAILLITWGLSLFPRRPFCCRFAPLTLQFSLFALVISSLIGHWPSSSPSSVIDPSHIGIVPCLIFAWGCVLLSITYVWLRKRIPVRFRGRALGLFSTFWCILAFPVITIYRILCMEPLAWQ